MPLRSTYTMLTQTKSSMKPTLYTTYSDFMARHFDGKVQKLPLDAGAGCPVRDGTLGTGGCAFCNGRSFVPDLCNPAYSIATQIEKAKTFFKRKQSRNVCTHFLGYFQAGSNTYPPVPDMLPHLQTALQTEGIDGLVLGTRPDCLPESWLDVLAKLAEHTFIMVELGVESISPEVLKNIGRGHTIHAAEHAIRALNERNIAVGVHLILGLPGESRESMLEQAAWLSEQPADVLKLHQLQILKGARMAKHYEQQPQDYHLFELTEYITLVADYLERLTPRIAIERFVSQAPVSSLIAPRWNVKNDEVTRRIQQELLQRGSYQGKIYPNSNPIFVS